MSVVQRHSVRPNEVILYVPFEVDAYAGQESAERALLAELPKGAEIIKLELPKAVEHAATLPSGVRIVRTFVPFPDEGPPRLIGMAHLAFKETTSAVA